MKITSHKLNTAHLSANERALSRCQIALELKDKGDYGSAQEIMLPLWGRVGDSPVTEGLDASVAAEVLLTVGVLTRWIGSKNRVEGAQECAKNLITEGITYYQSVGDLKRVAAARVELACCYWREGAFDEARIILNEALAKLTTEGNTRARAILRLAIVEWSSSRLSEGLKLLTDNQSLFNRITNHAIRGAYHSQLANVLTNLGTTERSERYLKQAIVEYGKADEEFKIAKNTIFRADVQNNLGFLLYKLSRFKEAHRRLEHSRRLRVSARDKIGIAQIDDTRAQVFIAEKKLKEAERLASNAVRILEKSGHQCLLSDGLVTHGIALARLGQSERAQHVFERAIDVGHEVGALNKAGLAALTLIEELDDAPTDVLCIAFDRASDWLADAQSDEILRRVNKAARKIFVRLRGEIDADKATEELVNPPRNLQTQVLNYERQLIRHALARTNGRLVRAAELLGTSYQGLGYIIGARHKDLLNERSPVRKRGKRKSE